MDRREFIKSAAAGAILTTGAAGQAKKIKTALIGCGSVSTQYLPNMSKCPYIELVSVCDIKPDRAEATGKKYNVPYFPIVDKQLAGPDFELLINTTSMPSHFPVNKKGLEAGKNMWSEKPMGTALSECEVLLELAHKKGVKIWGAPTVSDQSSVRVHGQDPERRQTRQARRRARLLRT